MLPPTDSDGARLRSIDAYRGFVMLAMVSGGIATFGAHPDSDAGEFSIPLELLLQQFDHVQWRGSVFWDLIQPSFMFLVGVSMPFSFNRRRARGDGWLRLFGHAVTRSLILIALGVFLASHGKHANELRVHKRPGADRPRIRVRLLAARAPDRPFNSPSRS